jgi:hypothetical protein
VVVGEVGEVLRMGVEVEVGVHRRPVEAGLGKLGHWTWSMMFRTLLWRGQCRGGP